MVYEFTSIQRIGSNRRRADGVRGFTTLQILAEIQKRMTEMECEPEQFQGRIIFMSMCNDIAWREKKETEKPVLRILLWLQIMLENSRKDIGRFLGLDKRSGTELTYTKPNGEWE